MRFRQLGMSGLQVSEFCLGAMNFGQQQYGIGEADSIRVIHAFLEAGGNFLDSADAYNAGISEQIIAKAVAGRRDSVIIATKGFFPCVMNFGDPPPHANALGTSRRHLTQALHDSLARLNTDYIDLYQVHCWDHRTPIEETLATLNDFVRSGKVRYVGLSNFSAWQIAESRQLCRQFGWEPFVTAQMQYSLICRTIEDDVIPVCQRYGMGILPWSPLGMGALTGKYTLNRPGPKGARFEGTPPNDAAAAWQSQFINPRSMEIVDSVKEVAKKTESTPATVSLAWLLTRPAVSSIIIGPKNPEQLQGHLAAADLLLPDDCLEQLTDASAPPMRYPEAFIDRSPRAHGPQPE